LKEGIFAAVWTLRHAIAVSPGGVADPIQLLVLDRASGGDWAARELADKELKEHVEAAEDAEDALKTWRSQFTTTPVGGPPEKPPD